MLRFIPSLLPPPDRHAGAILLASSSYVAGAARLPAHWLVAAGRRAGKRRRHFVATGSLPGGGTTVYKDRMTNARLEQQVRFLLEIDRLKHVLRQSYLVRSSRRENSAEHSWHVAVMALVLAEHATEPVDLARVVKMLLVHDIVEVDAGDTYVYDEAAVASREEREHRAAGRLFGLLPSDQGGELAALWEEFEAKDTPEARFATAVDRLMPVLHNLETDGRSWREHGISADRVLARNRAMAEGAPVLWEYARARIEEAVARGQLAPAAEPPARDPDRR
ncbi:MAG: HD family hydrolase [Thermoanaerobaculales bacterium]